MLEVINLSVAYGDAQVLWDISLAVAEGEIVTVVGPNGAGKTTLVNTLAGIVPARGGSIRMHGRELTALQAHKICQHGIAIVPEGRRLFPQMTVADNLDMGAFVTGARAHRDESLEQVFRIFPKLKDRARQRGGTLSGGEQQMLAIGRALMARPKLLLLDEPSLGLSPVMVDLIFDVLEDIRQLGVSTLLVEQHVVKALQAATRGYILEEGRIVQTGRSDMLIQDQHIQRAYLAYADGLDLPPQDPPREGSRKPQ
jgi:branched-chain amino acid transport system ATP-binding protein